MGRTLIDLTGNRYGYLTVLELDKEKAKNSGNKYWVCKCDCGNIKSIQGAHLKNGDVSSCGCHQYDKLKKYNSSKLKDLTGKTFGKWTVLSHDYANTHRVHYWKCQCECGNIVSVKGSSLTRGESKSCGCVKSYGEEKISSLLQELNIKFITQKTFPELKSEKGISLRIDFYLPDLNICIEYNGIQHYKAATGWSNEEHLIYTQKHDKIKQDYCQKNKIKLIIISYLDYKNLTSDFLKKKIFN